MSSKFKVKKITKFTELAEGKELEIPTSDLCLTSDKDIIQFEYVEDEEHQEKYIIKPGVYTLTRTSAGIRTDKSELRDDHLLTSVVNTMLIKKEFNQFFSKLDVYARRQITPVKRSILYYGAPGCHAKGTDILMFDGNVKKVEDIVVGDKLMGPDSTAREVLKLVRGREEMVRITPTKGESFVVNKNHILSLKYSGQESLQCPINISVVDCMSYNRERLKLYTVGVDFDNNKDLPVDPYILGLWLGDGHSRGSSLTSMDSELVQAWTGEAEKRGLGVTVSQKEDCKAADYHISAGYFGPKTQKNSLLSDLKSLEVINNKHIPYIYKTSSKENRLKLLAGLIDTDGSHNQNCFEITQKNNRLAEDIIFLARSLGFAAYSKKSLKKCQTGVEGEYNRITISGNTDQVPTKLLRKQAKERLQMKDVTRTGFECNLLEVDDFYGFTVDKDHLYLMGNFFVTHNCGKSANIRQTVKEIIQEDPGTVVLLWPTSEIPPEQVSRFFSQYSEYTEDCTKTILIVEEIGGKSDEGYGGHRDAVSSGLLNFLDGVNVTFRLPIFIVATTNYPALLLQNLADRPGRFDRLIELAPPNYAERVKLMEFFEKRELTDSEKTALNLKGADQLSIAHLQEIGVRSELEDLSFEEIIKQMLAHTEKFKAGFQKKRRSVGIMGDDE